MHVSHVLAVPGETSCFCTAEQDTARVAAPDLLTPCDEDALGELVATRKKSKKKGRSQSELSSAFDVLGMEDEAAVADAPEENSNTDAIEGPWGMCHSTCSEMTFAYRHEASTAATHQHITQQ